MALAAVPAGSVDLIRTAGAATSEPAANLGGDAGGQVVAAGQVIVDGRDRVRRERAGGPQPVGRVASATRATRAVPELPAERRAIVTAGADGTG